MTRAAAVAALKAFAERDRRLTAYALMHWNVSRYSEAEEDHLCVPCDAVTTHRVVWFQGMAWKTCEDCLYESCIDTPGEDDGPDDARQEEIENYREDTW